MSNKISEKQQQRTNKHVLLLQQQNHRKIFPIRIHGHANRNEMKQNNRFE